ncbi:MAG: RNA methyltransferase [Flavobacteriales bacterium]|nr:MAG: RNA methyltransferase [Flavobacteriales bacterium]
MKNYTMTATTLFGLEDVLAEELKMLGAMDVKKGVRSVSFVGDKGFMYKANMSLRTAIRILKPLKSFTARHEDELYNKIKKINWLDYINVEGSFAINAVVNSKQFTSNSHYISLKSKDAIVDLFREQLDKRPNIDLKHPDLRIHVHIFNQTCHVSLDSSGDSLHKRGYRDRTNIAPINEVLAAGMIMLSGYKGRRHFIDPMCGSGTILIEAAMIAANIPANINRKEFGFEKWSDFDAELFEIIRQSLMRKIVNPTHKIMGFDKAPSAVAKAKENIKRANLEDFVKVYQLNFFETEKQLDGPTMILFNPPYGERLQIDTHSFYKNIGDTLKQHYPDTVVWFITSDIQALKSVGLRTSRRLALKNGNLDCKFVRYDMYAGSKKAKYKT